LATLAGHTDSVNACAFSPDGRRIVSASRDNTLKLWDVESGKEQATLTGHTGDVQDCAYSPDGRQVVSASSDHTLKLWDAESGKEQATLTGHTGDVQNCAYSLDGRQVFSASSDHTLKLWNAESGVEQATLTGHAREVTSCGFWPDARRVFSVSEDKTLRLWDAQSGQEMCRHFLNGAGTAVACSPSGELVAGTRVGAVELVRAENLPCGPRIVTAWRRDTAVAREVEQTVHFGCPLCREWSGVPASALGSEIDCPKCGRRLRLNPFSINADWRLIAEAWRGETR
jgi:WD40 repeat protein